MSASSRNTRANCPDKSPGEICGNTIYTLKEAKSRLGWTDAAYRAAKRKGLSVLYLGKRAYIHGAEIIRFITEVALQKWRPHQ